LPNTKHVLLFDSRVDDRLKGGGIDVYIEANKNIESPPQTNVKIATKLQIALHEQKMDVLLFAPNLHELPIHRIAKETGVVLK